MKSSFLQKLRRGIPEGSPAAHEIDALLQGG